MGVIRRTEHTARVRIWCRQLLIFAVELMQTGDDLREDARGANVPRRRERGHPRDAGDVVYRKTNG